MSKANKKFFGLQLLFEATAGSGARRDVVIDDIIVLDDICPPEGELLLQCCVRSPWSESQVLGPKHTHLGMVNSLCGCVCVFVC